MPRLKVGEKPRFGLHAARVAKRVLSGATEGRVFLTLVRGGFGIIIKYPLRSAISMEAPTSINLSLFPGLNAKGVVPIKRIFER